ncbi:hypothetical protein ACB098_01G041200 [Castanea mollissima]|uniref:Calcium uniporter protein C-terminal domain-containing protein n=1 Tax=Castanea mollissima TaxID=60419 RepID=A0A8J4V6V4_9ROSI|nr:hypothetical protein CMV_023478 [Castanea mollissima]
MALRKTLAKRLFDGYRVKSPAVTKDFSPISPSSTVVPPNASKSSFHREYITSPDSSEKGYFRRFLHRRAMSPLPEFLSVPIGDKLREKLRDINITSGRISLEGLSPPAPEKAAFAGDSVFGISIQEAKKILRLSQVEKLKAKLREIPKSSISYSEFVRVCVQGCENEDQGAEFAKMLDDSGNVIVLGNVVFLRPEQVARSMETLISESIANPNDPRRRELEQMEMQKALIDNKARGLVRGELYCGLGFVFLQTLGFMRLTFWELSWDVMEPICFFVTSLHFALGYGFFLKTSTEPTFEGYFQRRFKAKQKKLMKIHNFDLDKYNELRKACYPSHSASPNYTHNFSSFKHEARSFVGAVN